MKSIAILLGLSSLLTSAQAADWHLVATSNAVKVYIDQDSIKASDENVRHYGAKDINESMVNLWVMYDQLSEPSYKSFKAQLALDCNRATVAYLYTVMYSGVNGNGEVVKSTTTPSKAVPVIPGSMDATIFEASCNNKL